MLEIQVIGSVVK